MENHNKVLYREIQRPRGVWLWASVLLCVVLMWHWFIKQIIFGVPVGNNPAPDAVTVVAWVIFGIAFPVVMLGILKLIIEVRHDGIYIRFIPFHFNYKQYLFKDIRDYENITYSPLKRFGGWGIRFNFQGETAYNLNGRKGIKLKLKYDTVVIGTQKPDELKKAMEAAQNTQ